MTNVDDEHKICYGIYTNVKNNNDEKINGFYEFYSNYKKSECEEEDKTDSENPEKIDLEITEKIDLTNPVKIDSENPMKIVNCISKFYIDDDILIRDVDITNIKGSEKMELKYIGGVKKILVQTY